MKVGIIFFGHLRTFSKTFPSIYKHLISRYNCDIYMHTWSEIDYKSDIEKKIDINSKELDPIKRITNNKRIRIEKQDKFKWDRLVKIREHKRGDSYISLSSMKGMLDSWTKAVEMCEEEKNEYDLLVILRPDLKLFADLKLDNLFNEINCSLDINARFTACCLPKKMKEQCIITDIKSDIITIGRPECIYNIAKIFRKLDYSKIDGKLWSPENYYTSLLATNGVSSFSIPYYYGRDWIISRKIKLKTILKQIIRVRLNFGGLRILFFSFFEKKILHFKCSFFNSFSIEICFGFFDL